MSTEPNECWSADNEHFAYGGLGELLDNDDNLRAGCVVYKGVAAKPSASRLFDASDALEQMRDRADDIAGEYAEGFGDEANKEALAELGALVTAWIEKHLSIDFYEVKNVKEYTLTVDDFDEDDERRNGEPK